MIIFLNRGVIMINKLHLAMIELYNGDSNRIQHFCKVHSYAKLIGETENINKDTLFVRITKFKIITKANKSSLPYIYSSSIIDIFKSL